MDAFELLVEAHRPAMKAVLAKLVRLLETHNVRYAIGGASALALYVRPRMTVDVDAFVDARCKADVDQLMAAEFQVVKIGGFHSKFTDSDVDVDILYAGASAEDFALAHPRDAVILGTKLKAASPEALLWLYLLSDREQHFVDALNLLRTHADLGIAELRQQLQRHQPDLLGKLDKMIHTAQQPVASYEESRERRSK